MYKPAQTCAPIHPLIASRWSPRAFDVHQIVSNHSIAALLEAARWTPSCYGAEPWRFVVCNHNQKSDAWQKAFDCLAAGNQLWAKNAQLLILACAEMQFSHNGAPNRHAAYDCGAAVMSLVLEAENQGLRCHQMGGFCADTARRAFSVAETFECMAMIAVGYQATGEHKLLSDQLHAAEVAVRTRKPLGECFFDGEWDKPMTRALEDLNL